LWAMVNAIKELSEKNDELAAEVASLKSQINN
jgi:cell division protein FtsB